MKMTNQFLLMNFCDRLVDRSEKALKDVCETTPIEGTTHHMRENFINKSMAWVLPLKPRFEYGQDMEGNRVNAVSQIWLPLRGKSNGAAVEFKIILDIETGYIGRSEAFSTYTYDKTTYDDKEYYKAKEFIAGFAQNHFQTIVVGPFQKHIKNDGDSILQSGNAQQLGRNLFRLYQLQVNAHLDFFTSHLNQDVVETMRIAQFPGVVFYNWLLGCPRAVSNNDEAPFPDEILAKKRQQFVLKNPQLGHIIGYTLAHGRPISGNVGGISDKPANSGFFGFEKNSSFHTTMDINFIAGQFFYEENERRSITAQIRSPDFWKDAEGQLRDLVGRCNDIGAPFRKYTILNEVLGTIDTHDRHKNAKPSFPRGLVL